MQNSSDSAYFEVKIRVFQKTLKIFFLPREQPPILVWSSQDYIPVYTQARELIHWATIARPESGDNQQRGKSRPAEYSLPSLDDGPRSRAPMILSTLNGHGPRNLKSLANRIFHTHTRRYLCRTERILLHCVVSFLHFLLRFWCGINPNKIW